LGEDKMKILPIIFLMLLPIISFATSQQKDLLKYAGEEFEISIFPLEESPIRKTKSFTFPIPEDYKAPVRFAQNTNSVRGVISSTANHRGYVATWEVEDNKLYLTEINGWIADPHHVSKDDPRHDDPKHRISWLEYTYRKATLDQLFPDQVKNGRVLADWYSGELFIGGWHPGIKRSDEILRKQEQQAPLIFQVENGIIKSITDRRTPD
jgi:hypothetical protein